MSPTRQCFATYCISYQHELHCSAEDHGSYYIRINQKFVSRLVCEHICDSTYRKVSVVGRLDFELRGCKVKIYQNMAKSFWDFTYHRSYHITVCTTWYAFRENRLWKSLRWIWVQNYSFTQYIFTEWTDLVSKHTREFYFV